MKLLLPLVAIAVYALGLASALAAAPFDAWKHSGSIYLLTTPEGANLPAGAEVNDFPVLIRLHQDFFDFRQAKAGGEDVRFSSAAGRPLAHQIENWDAKRGDASLWVRVPKIAGNARQEIKLHWGNADADDASDGKAVFNASNGYLSVWHMSGEVRDEVGTLPSEDKGTTDVLGMIGQARHFPGQKGVFCGDKIAVYPAGASSHSTEAWFRTTQPNTTIIGWGNEGGGRGSKVRMLLRSPPHIRVDSDFADVKSESRLPLGEWIHVVHTYDREDGKLYINGRLDGSARPLLDIKSPGRLWLGGWYHHYDFVGDIDEVRVSQVARSADWIKLQYENQKPQQTLAGCLVQPGSEFSASPTKVTVKEGQSVPVSASAGGAQKVYWILKRDGQETVVATDRFAYTFDAGRTRGDQSLELQFKAIYAGGVKRLNIPITILEAVAEPEFTLAAPATWDGRDTIEIVPAFTNLGAIDEKHGKFNYAWAVDGIAVIKQAKSDRLVLKRAQNSGRLKVTVAIDNGGAPVVRSATIVVREPAKDAWVQRTPGHDEQPEDNQFFARDDSNEGSLFYNGALADAADSVFLRVYADDKLYKSASAKLAADKTYAFTVKLKPGLVIYRTEFGSKSGERETVLHAAKNLVCGDAFLINGQSNAVANDIGPNDIEFTSPWIRTYGSTADDPTGSRLKRWDNAVVRNRQGGQAEIGAWGMELAKRLVENQQMPICLINGAVGGTRIDQHQRNAADPTDAATIYGRLLWRVQAARLTHGIRGVLWHQGENDQGADGPSGGFGYETYRQYFVDLSADWKSDFPNIQHYYLFQIWPKACAMGVDGSDNKLREVQRTLPRYYSNLHVMSTLGIKPPGGCHYPLEGYAEFARLIGPLVERDHYSAKAAAPITPANLTRAYFTSGKQDEVALEFDQDIVWNESLADQFSLDGDAQQIASGAASGKVLTLTLKSPSKAKRVTYLDSRHWNPNNLLNGANGIAALTFCDVLVEAAKAK